MLVVRTLLVAVLVASGCATQSGTADPLEAREADTGRVDPDLPAANQALDEVAARLASSAAARVLGVRDLSLRYLAGSRADAVGGGWTGDVVASWRLGQSEILTARVRAGFGPGRDGLSVLTLDPGLRPGQGSAPWWLTEPVSVRRTAGTVVVDASSGGIRRLPDQAERAARAVRRLLPDWQEPLVLEVAPSRAAFVHVLGARWGGGADVAAMTGRVGFDPSNPLHVYLNPAALGRLTPRGIQLVLRHEAAHVATSAPGSPAPAWLVEGFAEYVARRDLPTPAAPTADGTRPDTEYDAAWRACALLVERGGESALLDLYREVQDGGDLDVALGERFGLDEQALRNGSVDP